VDYPAPYTAATNTYSRIQDTSLTFTPYGSTTPITQQMEAKAIQELWETNYGRMNATLGVELPFTNANNQTTIPFGYIDPPTEIIQNGETQIWKITHNGVDTHAIHFHLFNVQLINRVGWDGAIRPPDPNELGWKETVRMNPLEDAIVALKPVLPLVPFAQPDSIRPLDPTQPLGATLNFWPQDPQGNPVTTVNEMTNFGHEYVWHCHLLGHEENDMMRPIVMTNVCSNSTAIQALVREYYLAILGREPDQAGWDYWSNQICHIESLGIYIGEGFQSEARFFFNSQEYLAAGKNDAAFVTDLYHAFLQREPDAGGLAYWVDQLNQGLTRNMLITAFAYSNEFTAYLANIFGADTTRPENNILNDFYRGLLNRIPDTAGYNFWLLQMRIAQCQGAQAVRDMCYQISLLFVLSQEYTDRNRNNAEYVEDLYNAILKRGAEPAGYLFWVNNLNSGMTRQQLLQAFTNSAEFQTRVNAVIAAGCLP
jgi:hypothetical protein